MEVPAAGLPKQRQSLPRASAFTGETGTREIGEVCPTNWLLKVQCVKYDGNFSLDSKDSKNEQTVTTE